MTTWQDAFGWFRDHRDLPDLSVRFQTAGLTPDQADRLIREGLSPSGLTAEDWAEAGPLGIALVTAEIDRAADVARRRAAALRSAAINDLAQDQPIADIARQVGQTRQAVSKAAHGERTFFAWARDLATSANRMTENGVPR